MLNFWHLDPKPSEHARLAAYLRRHLPDYRVTSFQSPDEMRHAWFRTPPAQKPQIVATELYLNDDAVRPGQEFIEWIRRQPNGAPEYLGLIAVTCINPGVGNAALFDWLAEQNVTHILKCFLTPQRTELAFRIRWLAAALQTQRPSEMHVV